MLPLLYSEGVRSGRISLARFVELTSTAAARIFGLYPRKGEIRVGADADIALWDFELRRTIRSESLLTRAGYSPYEGIEVTGWPVATLRRGELAFEQSRVTAQPGSRSVRSPPVD
jgi:dihydropyrimidinase